MTPEIQWFKTSDLRNLIFEPFNNCILILLVLDTGGSEMTDELELCQVCMYWYIKKSQDVLWGFLGFFTCNKCVKNYEWSFTSCMVLNFMDSNVTIIICTTYIAWRACRKQEDIWFRSGNGPLFMNQTIVHVIS